MEQKKERKGIDEKKLVEIAFLLAKCQLKKNVGHESLTEMKKEFKNIAKEAGMSEEKLKKELKEKLKKELEGLKKETKELEEMKKLKEFTKNIIEKFVNEFFDDIDS